MLGTVFPSRAWTQLVPVHSYKSKSLLQSPSSVLQPSLAVIFCSCPLQVGSEGALQSFTFTPKLPPFLLFYFFL